MARTTIDIEPSVLAELKRRQRREGKTLGRLVSEMLSDGLAGNLPEPPEPFVWRTRSMSARVDLEDTEAVRRAMDG